MASLKATKTANNFNINSGCVNRGPDWDQALWEAIADDIDREITSHLERLATLRSVRRNVMRNADQKVPFPAKLRISFRATRNPA